MYILDRLEATISSCVTFVTGHRGESTDYTLLAVNRHALFSLALSTNHTTGTEQPVVTFALREGPNVIFW